MYLYMNQDFGESEHLKDVFASLLVVANYYYLFKKITPSKGT